MLCSEVLIDSGAFTELNLYGEYKISVSKYALELQRLSKNKIINIIGAVAQDYMCEDFILKKTGLTIPIHQKLTIERYDELIKYNFNFPVLPVLQGFSVQDYLTHIDMYGDRLSYEMWVGVGSICKRNSDPKQILSILQAIKEKRPDLKLHGFGVKQTSLKHKEIMNLLYSADSMAWSFAARYEGRNSNDWREAKKFIDKIFNKGK